MNGVRSIAVCELGGSEVESQSVGTWREIHQSFEVGVGYRPVGWRKGIVLSAHSQIALQRLGGGICYRSINGEDLLVDLRLVSDSSFQHRQLHMNQKRIPKCCL